MTGEIANVRAEASAKTSSTWAKGRDGVLRPVGSVTVWMMSREPGNPLAWNTKLVPREPLAGIALIVGAACGGGGGAVRTGVAGATVGAVVGAGAGVLAPVAPV